MHAEAAVKVAVLGEIIDAEPSGAEVTVFS